MKKILIIPVFLIALVSCKTTAVFKVSSLSTKDSTDICNINKKLPVVSEQNGLYGELCDKINTDIKNKTNALLIDFKKDAYEFYDEYVLNTKNPSSARYEYFGDYDQFYAGTSVISYRYINYIYTGGNHGRTEFNCYNYDIKTGKRLKFSDVFKTNEESINKINTLLAKYFENPNGCFSSKPSVNSEYSFFTIQKDSIFFTFHPYELGAYACGSPVIKVPTKDFVSSGVYSR